MDGASLIRRMGANARLLALALCAMLPQPAAAQLGNVQITGLSDVSFGSISTLSADQVRAQSVCAYSGLLGGRYSVTAAGSGTGGAFTLANGSALLPYEVQWTGTANQTSGTNLTANVPLSGQTMPLNCLLGQVTDASLIVILRGTALSAAQSGSYSGTLTIILAAN
ncbi:hypothetical protein [Sphingobium sp.]|uniref:hypothetical protein n=1 Tax=Sphingobium sp. TaxID=1912891 RepID=UPI003B3AF8D5